MSVPSTHRNGRAFSLIELLVILAIATVVAIIAAVFLAKQVRERDRASRLSCINNQKQISTALRLFGNDDPRYPFTVFSDRTNMLPGIEPFNRNNPGDLWKLFHAVEYLESPGILYCPSDRGRSPARDFNTNGLPSGFALPSNRLNALSYFLSLDADEARPQLILLGDRYLTTDPESSSEKATQFLFGQKDLSSGAGLEKRARWISTLHQSGGNAAFMDGSARQLTTSKLRDAILHQPDDYTNRIWLPNTDATGRGNP